MIVSVQILFESICCCYFEADDAAVTACIKGPSSQTCCERSFNFSRNWMQLDESARHRFCTSLSWWLLGLILQNSSSTALDYSLYFYLRMDPMIFEILMEVSNLSGFFSRFSEIGEFDMVNCLNCLNSGGQEKATGLRNEVPIGRCLATELLASLTSMHMKQEF